MNEAAECAGPRGVEQARLDTWNSDAPAAVAEGKVLRIVRFTSSSAETQQAAMKLVDEEINPLYAAARGFRWVKYYTDAKTLETGSVSAWDSVTDVETFLSPRGATRAPVGRLRPGTCGAGRGRVPGDIMSGAHRSHHSVSPVLPRITGRFVIAFPPPDLPGEDRCRGAEAVWAAHVHRDRARLHSGAGGGYRWLRLGRVGP